MKRALTLAEAVWLARRRAGLTQRAWAERMRATVHEVYDWERGVKAPHDPSWVVTEATPLEWALVLRRRSGLGLHRCAAAMGISHVTLLKRERGEGRVDELMRYWAIPYKGMSS